MLDRAFRSRLHIEPGGRPADELGKLREPSLDVGRKAGDADRERRFAAAERERRRDNRSSLDEAVVGIGKPLAPDVADLLSELDRADVALILAAVGVGPPREAIDG